MGIPYVIEGSGNKERSYDLYSRLLKDRIIFIGKEFTDDLANSVVAQLLFLEADDPEKDIIVYINSPGGLVSAELAIFDTMMYIKPDVSTVCIGQAASAAAFILTAGTKGKRYALKNARIMLHQVSSGTSGHIEDIRIQVKEAEILNEISMKNLSDITGHTVEKILKDLNRDYYMGAEQAKDYRIIDEVLITRS
jgi:ATP-dependent Clp protease protease subunit